MIVMSMDNIFNIRVHVMNVAFRASRASSIKHIYICCPRRSLLTSLMPWTMATKVSKIAYNIR